NTRREEKGEKLRSIGYEFESTVVKGVEGVMGKGKEKEIEGGKGEELEEEKTVVTTDGKDGKLVISEEVKVTKKKAKAGKRKADEGEVEGVVAEGKKKTKKIAA
ncbi:MAG: hypothetical protein Q9170_008388, partial [Blastenia crenularia]